MSAVLFVDALDMLGLRLEGDGSFNLESVLRPLKDQISLTIMDYQATSHLINELVSSQITQIPLYLHLQIAK